MKPIACILSILFMACASQSPTPTATRWYKGNLHTHSYWSDGDEFPERIMDWYKSRGYHFLALTDHNRLAEGDYWIELPEGEHYQQAFEAYIEEYGEDWVVYRQDSGRTEVKLKTLAEYSPLFEEAERFLIIKSEEITDQFEGKPLHLNATNLHELIVPQGGSSVVDVLQNNINAVMQQRQATGEPMIVHINHPNFHYAISLQDMIQLQGERFFEVYNGHPQVHNLGDSTHIGTEEMWDLVNLSYLQQGKPLVFSLATDDSHHYHQFDRKWSNAGRGWIMVEADTLAPRALIAAIEAGRFYASTGVSLSGLSCSENVLSLEVAAEEGVDYDIAFIGCYKGDSLTQVLQQSRGTKAEFRLGENLLFVRAKVVSSKRHPNPIETLDFEMAWTQPVQPE